MKDVIGEISCRRNNHIRPCGYVNDSWRKKTAGRNDAFVAPPASRKKPTLDNRGKRFALRKETV
jgi:hypothetical protein